ncbi:MAG: EAL domain-containing protein [Gammaproteobacteria bacterium]|nr:EAL domain-containing protein [Gammaproteobacteria bacterium]
MHKPDLFRAMTLKRKVIFAFAGMLLLMLVGTGFVLYRLAQTVTVGNDVILLHQPAALSSVQLIRQVNLASALLSNYLLTGDKRIKEEFYQHKDVIYKTANQIAGFQELQKSKNKKVFNEIHGMLARFFAYAEELFHLRENELENYPGLALASQLTDPSTLAYLGTVNDLLDSGLDEVPRAKRQRVRNLLQDLRYSWVQMNNAFRIFMTTRQHNDLENFYNYSDTNGLIHKRLRELHVDLGFNALAQLEEYRAQRLKNVPTVAKVFQGDAWRKDVYLLKTEVNPLLDKISMALQAFASSEIGVSAASERELAARLNQTYTFAGIILIAGILLASIVGSLIIKSLRPISALTDSVNKLSLDHLVPLDTSLARREDEVGRLARSFDRMTKHLIQDIRERKIAERKFETLLESLSDATVIVDQSGLIKLFNFQAEMLFGYTKEEVIDKPVEILLPLRYRAGHTLLLRDYTEKPQFKQMGKRPELYGLRKNGEEIPVEIGLSPIETSEGLLISAAVRDITERKIAEEKLIHQANYDSLTGLPNRSLALERLSHAITGARRKPHPIAVMFVDLDNFKQVNDSLGHSVGDVLLQHVGNRLNECIRANDTVARLGGDEFLIVVPRILELHEIDVIAQKIIDTVGHPFSIDERDIYLGASIGITLFPTDGEEPEVLLRNADAAMYQAKKAGRNTFRFFTAEMNKQLLARLDIESKLRSALEKDELFLNYQPLFELENNKVIGVEALLRWKNLTLGLVMPDTFIHIAEETGLINKIGEWVLRESCRKAATWQQTTGIPVRIAVNISPAQFRSSDLVAIVKEALAESGLAADLLELEMTERVLIDDNPNVNRILKDIRRLGVRLALDDFGTGYSSLGYLKRFRFDVLKIDRMFVSDITVNPETESLCKAIVAMAQSMDLEVVAEGVENVQQLEILRGLGVTFVQGYYLSPPSPADKIQEILTRKSPLLRPV